MPLAFVRATFVLTVFCLLVLQAKSEEKAKGQDDMKVLQGDWICVMEEIGGKPYTKNKVKEMNKRMNIDKKHMIVKRVINEKLGVYEGNFELDEMTKPKKFDFKGTGPGGNQVEMRGIYELSEDKFKLIYVLKGLRPREFKTAEGGIMVDYKREKD